MKTCGNIEELKWIVTRVNGKIASVHLDYSGLCKVADAVKGLPCEEVASVTCEKISTADLVELNKGLTLDDMAFYGTEFQKKVWTELFRLGHDGRKPQVISYSEFAEICGNRPGIRAVAHAVGLNPCVFINPCHRIVPKACIGRMEEAYQTATDTIFNGSDIYVFNVFDFGEFALGKQLKRDLIALELTGQPTKTVNAELTGYIENNIIPRYKSFDKAHQTSHAYTVIRQSLELASHYDVNIDMVYAIAAYHDTGLAVDRKTHHLESGKIVRADENLLRWFSKRQIETMAKAVEDHRASNGKRPRSIYGKIVAEADRQIDTEVVIRRTIQYGISHYPELDMEGHWQRTLDHLHEKYADGGYLRLWIPESPNAARLGELRAVIADEVQLREMFERIYSEEK
ncbi:MAG: MGMT family protein [Bacteroidales bacterium]|nr:MGMT family protein [Candidatus Cryptobacteroides onthequi]